jgi:hypothetical protein
MTVIPERPDPEIVIDLGVRPRPGEQPTAADPVAVRARTLWRPWLVGSCLAALLVLFPDSAAVPAHRAAVADPLPTTSSAPNLGQLYQFDQRYMYQHGPVRPHPGATQWCWIEQRETGEMALVPCADANPTRPVDR